MEEFLNAVKEAKMRIWGECKFLPEGLINILNEKENNLDIKILLDHKNIFPKEKQQREQTEKEEKEEKYRISKRPLTDTYFIIDEDSFVYSTILNKFSRYPWITEKETFMLYWDSSAEF